MEMCLPFTFLCRRIVRCGIWPRAWTTHWIHPLHKKGSKGDVLNFRGIHLTAQISKAAERFIGTLFVPRLQRFSAFGVNQFAYSKGRGARDAILFYICSWLSSFNRGMRVALYCADVAAAFDRVDAGRLMEKLYCKGVHMDILRILRSWLQARSAYVVVNGVKSTSLTIGNMVFQGTVWGPILWNIFVEDSRRVVRAHGFTEGAYADDLNSFKEFPSNLSNHHILNQLEGCQHALHAWGRALRRGL